MITILGIVGSFTCGLDYVEFDLNTDSISGLEHHCIAPISMVETVKRSKRCKSNIFVEGQEKNNGLSGRILVQRISWLGGKSDIPYDDTFILTGAL